MGAYVTKLPSTPQMARYTAAPSSYTDPVVGASPPNPWGSSLGECVGCGDLGAVDVSAQNLRKYLPLVGAITGYYLLAPAFKVQRTEGLFVGLAAAWVVGDIFFKVDV